MSDADMQSSDMSADSMPIAPTPAPTQAAAPNPEPAGAPKTTPDTLSDNDMQSFDMPEQKDMGYGEQAKTALEQWYSGQTGGLSKLVEANPGIVKYLPG